MKCCGVFLLSLLLLSVFAQSLGKEEEKEEKVTIAVKGVTTVAKTDDNFVCATMDWWPPEKCNYGWCPWGQASAINLDLKNPILLNALKAFKGLRIRVGGSIQDQIVYKFGPNPPKCQNFKKEEDGLFGFSEGCLTPCRWKKLNGFFNKTGAVVTFGLNALYGRTRSNVKEQTGDWLYEGNWNSTNARELIKYTVEKGYNIESWEFGNELAGGVSAFVKGDQYGKDLIVLRQIIDELYKNSSNKPKLLAPGAFYSQQWFEDMFKSSGPGVVDVVTHHIYNLGPGDDKDLIHKIQNPLVLDNTAQTYYDVEETIRNFGSWSSAWIGESGGAFNSGGKGVSNTFVDGFWYLDQLGQTSTFNHKVFCRQALIGGNYALINTTTFVPNPDYYGALLWHRLMGPGVLQTSHNGSPDLRAYAHCSKDKDSQDQSAVTLLLINLSNSTTLNISVASDLNLYPPQLTRYTQTSVRASGAREEYHLTPQDGNLQSQVMLLNGVPLKLTGEEQIPELQPRKVDADAPLQIAPSSIAFVKFKSFNAPACN